MKTTTAKTVLVSEIKDRDSKRFGVTCPGSVLKGHQAEIVIGSSVRLFGTMSWGKAFDVTFKLGDQAEYGSFNLSYYGTITSITDKTITIVENHGGKVHRLSLYQFAWRNYDFNVDAAFAKNSETMMYI